MRARLPKLTFIRRLVNEILDDDVTDLGAMMAYYTVLALFPMIVFIVTIALLAIDPATIHAGVLMATRTLPDTARLTLSDFTTKLIDGADGGLAVGSALIAMWGASRGAAAFGIALNVISKRKETRPWWKRQVTAVAVTAAVALMAVLAMGLLVVGPLLGHYVADKFGLGGAFDVLWALGRWVGAGLLVMFVCAIMFKFLPDSRVPFRVFTVGSLVGVSGWIVISLAFNLYLTNFGSYDATYGTLGGAIIFLTYLWLSNICLLVGAEVNDVMRHVRREKAEAFLAHDVIAKLDDRDLGRSDASR